MNRFIPVSAVLCALGLSISSAAQLPNAQLTTNTKIVVLNFNSAVLQTAESQKELRLLEARFAPRQSELQALNSDIETSRKLLASTSEKLNDIERAQREQTLNNKVKQFQRKAEDFKNDSESESQQMFQRVAQRVYSFLQDYSKQHGYAMVIERGAESAPVVWYAASDVDVTEEFIKSYDAQSLSPVGRSLDGKVLPKQIPAKVIDQSSPPK